MTTPSPGWLLKTIESIKAPGKSAIAIGPFGSRMKSDQYTDTGVPVVRGNNLGATKHFVGDFVYVADSTADELTSSNVAPGDLVFPHRGNIGSVGIIPDSMARGMLSTSMMKLTVDRSQVDPLFLYYFFSSELGRFELLKHASQVGTPGIATPLTSLRSIQFPLPHLTEQKAIVNVLSQIDDKIEINRRQLSRLAEIVRTLFKAWFVNFTPVRAKKGGRAPFGLDAETVALFPSEFEDSDLGEIPAGWSATTLADIVTERTGKVGADNGHVVLSAVASGELKRSDEHFTKQVYSQDTSKYKRVEQWDYAYNPSRINIGSIGMLEEPIVGAVSPVYTVLRPAQGYEWFLRFFLDLPQTREVINQFCSGSVRQSLSFKDFAAIPVVLPPKEIAEAFARRWQELNALRQQLEAQSRQLAEVRDTLLPKLMSGELRVPESLMA